MNIPTAFPLDTDQTHALELMLSGRNVFLTGKAGTGKSTVLHRFQELAGPNTIFLAPTGLAALNINGETIHRFLGLAVTPVFPVGFANPLDGHRRDLVAATECVVLDEIGMVRSDLFAVLENTFSSVPLPDGAGRPFGGRQIVCVGDFHQLPPVLCNEDWNLFMVNYDGLFAFQTPAWRDAKFAAVELGQVHRQDAGERQFLAALDSIRRGGTPEAPLADAIEWINANARTGQTTPPGATALCTTRRGAAAINTILDSRLDGRPFVFKAIAWGEFDEASFPADLEMGFRIGSRVVMLANTETPWGDGFVNGETGTVQEVNLEGGEPAVLVALDRGRSVCVRPHVWLHKTYTIGTDPFTGRPTICQLPLGGINQLPMKLAYALTIHKAQGTTLDRVHIHLGAWGTFVSGQLYTGLSRVRSLAGLSLDRPLFPEDAITSSAVLDFHESLSRKA